MPDKIFKLPAPKDEPQENYIIRHEDSIEIYVTSPLWVAIIITVAGIIATVIFLIFF